MAIPFKIRLYSDTQIFGFFCMFKLVSMSGVWIFYWCLVFYFVWWIELYICQGERSFFLFLFPYALFIQVVLKGGTISVWFYCQVLTPGIPIRRPRRGQSSTEQSAVNNCWGRYVKSDFMNIWRVNPVLSS